MCYNSNRKIKYVLIKSGGGNRPCDARQPDGFIKVPIPADYPKDEVLCRFVFGAAFIFIKICIQDT